MRAISSILGVFVKFIYDGLASIMPHEPAQVSFFALSIICLLYTSDAADDSTEV